MASENHGNLRPNKKKEKSSHPDYRGKVTIEGREYFVAGWRKQDGEDVWVSLEFELKTDATL